MEELQAALHKHLGGPKKYTLFKQAIGSKQTKLGFHGMISLSVFAKTDEVKNGNFVPYEGANARVVQGVNLGVTKAGNKGAVGMGFRYYDASIAFLVSAILYIFTPVPPSLLTLTKPPPSSLLPLPSPPSLPRRRVILLPTPKGRPRWVREIVTLTIH